MKSTTMRKAGSWGWLVLVSTAWLAPGGAANAATDTELAAFKSAIRAKYDMKERAFRDRDGETIVTKFYSGDVMSIGEGSPLHRGRDELRKVYESPEVINSEVRVVSFDTRVSGDLGWDWADFHVTPADPKVSPFTFKILFLWERTNGEWWCKGDMYVVDRSAASAAGGTQH